MRRTWKTKAALLSAASATFVLAVSEQAHAGTLAAEWSGDGYTASSTNITDSVGGIVGTNVGTNLLVPSFFGTHAGINTSAGGFTLPKLAIGATGAAPPTGLTSFTIATTFLPTAAQTTGGAAWQTPDFLGYDIGGAGKADFGLGFGGGSGLSFVAGGGNAANGNDYTITSSAVALNVVHSAVFQVEDAAGAANAGSVTLYVDGAFVGQQTGLTILPMNPAAAGTNYGLAGRSGGDKPTLLGVVGTVRVYNDSAGVTNGLALSDSLVTGYGGTSNLYEFNVSSGSATSGASYANGLSPVGNALASVDISNGGTAQIASIDALPVSQLFVGGNFAATGAGTVNQTGGAVNVSNLLLLGQGGSSATYALSGGNLNYSGGNQISLKGNASNPASITIGGGAGTAQMLINTGTNNVVTSIGEGATANAVVNVLPGGTFNSTGGEVWIGNNGAVGVLNVSGGTVRVNNWLAPGRLGGTGTINITGGGILTKTGGGNLDIAGDGANSKGYINQINGVLNTNSTILVTENNASEIAVVNMSAGSVTNSAGGIEVGTAGNGTLNIANSVFNASGGTSSTVGGNNSDNFATNGAAIGLLNLTTGGTFNNATAQTFIGNSGGTGTANISGGTLNVHNYLAVGRRGGIGTVYLGTGGTINVTQNNIFTDPVTTYNSVNLGVGFTVLGTFGTNGQGYLYQTGGTFNSPNAVVVLGETAASGTSAAASGVWNISGGSAILPSSALTPTNFLTSLTIGQGGNGTLNLSGTGQLTAGAVVIAQNGGTNASNGTLNIASNMSATHILVGQGGNGTLNLTTGGQITASSLTLAAGTGSTSNVNLSGGTLTTTGIAYGNGTANLNLNGTTLRALNDNSNFLSAVEGAPLALGSALTLDTQTNRIGIQQSLSGPGPLTKLGTGTLNLAASNSYTGNTLVNAGTLTVGNANALGTGTAILANGSTLALSTQSTTLQSFSNAYKTNQSNVFAPQNSGNDNAVTLTVPQNSVSNSTFLQDSQIVNIDDTTGFIANFTYNHASQGPEQTGADGFAFILQNGSAQAVGGAGGSLGYNASGYSSSIAAAVDLFLDRVDLGSGNGSSGALTNVPAENSSPLISQTTSSNVAIVYTPGAGGLGTLTITLTNSSGGVIATNSTPNFDAAVALGGGANGTAQARLGFTGATGGANDLQSISDFSFNQTGTTLSYNAVNITNAVKAADGATTTLQLAPTANFSSGAVGPITIGNSSTLSVSIGASAAAGVTRGVLTAPSITFVNSSSGTLNVGANALDITGQTRDVVRASLVTGFANGAWNGPGISSTAAASDSQHLTALGIVLNSVDGTTTGAALYGNGTALGLFEGINPASTDVLVKYTYYGDANLSGKVDASDYSRIDSGFLAGSTGWYNGDFNYDGVVNGSDYTLIDNAFNRQGASLAASLASPLASVTSEIAGSGASAVPEPTTLSLLAIGAAGLLGRRRRHH